MTISLPYRPPYDWQGVRDFYMRRQIMGNEHFYESGFKKVLCVEQKNLLINVVHKPHNNCFDLSYTAHAGVKDCAEHVGSSNHQRDLKTISKILSNVVRRMLDLDAEPQLIKAGLLKAGLRPSEIVNGLRIPGVASDFEAGCRAILGQQVSVVAAVNKLNQFFEHFKEQSQLAFPAPELVAESDLSFLRVPAARRHSIKMLAGLLADKPHSRADDWLDIKGIGPWTVNYVLMRAQSKTDIWLSTDLVVKQQLAKLEGQGRQLDDKEASPWRSYLSLNLWRMTK